MATKTKVTVAGKPYDLDKLEEVTQLQALLVPENYPGSKRDGVRLFLSLQNMLAKEMKRHLAHNFSKIVKTAFDEQKDGDTPVVAIAFGFDINLTAPTVAAHGKCKMSFSRKFSTEGKPKTHDINQGEFLDEDLSVILDTKALDLEMAPPPEGEKRKPGRPKKNAAKEAGKTPPAGKS